MSTGLKKAVFINTEEKNRTQIEVMFNPPEILISKSNQFSEENLASNSSVQFGYQDVATMELTLFLDTTSTGDDVQVQAYRIVRLANVKQDVMRPPKLLFVWGSVSVSCIIQSIRQSYSYFSRSGWPMRAELKVSLKSWDNFDASLSNTVANSAKGESGIVLKQSQTLQSVSNDVYGDPREWRKVAELNKIERPLSVKPGKTLAVPAGSGMSDTAVVT